MVDMQSCDEVVWSNRKARPWQLQIVCGGLILDTGLRSFRPKVKQADNEDDGARPISDMRTLVLSRQKEAREGGREELRPSMGS